MDSDYFPNVSAKSIEEFTELTNKIKTLPKKTINQIKKVEKSLMGVDCVFKDCFAATSVMFYLPKNTTQIKDFGDFIGIYCENFFFRIEGDTKLKKLEYVLDGEISS